MDEGEPKPGETGVMDREPCVDKTRGATWVVQNKVEDWRMAVDLCQTGSGRWQSRRPSS